MPKIDAPVATSNKETERGMRWVVVPERDLFDFTFPTIRINLLEFGPGRHYVEADTADQIENRIRAKQDADIRVMRPSQDVTSQNAMNRFGAGAGRGQFLSNPDSVMKG